MQRSFRRKDAWALTVLGLFCLVLFREIVISGHLLIGDDFVTFYLAMKKFLYDHVRLQHEIPYWNPYIFGGMPFWAHFESTIFYPLGFLFYLLSPEKAYGYTMFLHFMLAGFFMYLLIRSLGVSGSGAFIASAVFVANGYLMAILFLGHMSPVESYIWLPLVIYFVNRAVRADAIWLSAMIAGALWGIQILAGAPQDAFYTYLSSALFLLCLFRHDHGMKASAGRPIAIALIVFVVGAGLSSIQILPALELVHESVRASLDTYEWSTLASYPLQGIITIFMPRFFGNYADASVWVSNMPWSIPQQTLYVGVLPLVLLGFVSVQRKVEKRIIVFGGFLALVSLILAFGHHTPVYKIAYLLPGFDRFRAPSKIMVLWAFSMALLAGVGMDGLFSYLRRESSRRLYPLVFLALGLVALILWVRHDPSVPLKVFSPFVLPDAIPGRMSDAARIISEELYRLTLFISSILLLLLLLRRRLLPLSVGPAALCALLLMDLGYVHEKAVRHDDNLYAAIEKIKESMDAGLGKDKSLFRVGSFKHTLGANLEMVLGYQTVGGFTALVPSRYYEYMMRYSNDQLPKAWVSLFYGYTENQVFMDLLNVKYEISHQAKGYGLRETVLPRAFLVPQYRVLPKGQILSFLSGPDFNPTQEVVLEAEGLADVPLPRPQSPSPVSGQVKVVSYHPDRMTCHVLAEEPCFLFISESYYPGWKAFIDGQPTRILKGNYLFRVVEVPSGRHEIELVFTPHTIRLGIGVSALTLVFIIGLLIAASGRRYAVGRVS